MSWLSLRLIKGVSLVICCQFALRADCAFQMRVDNLGVNPFIGTAGVGHTTPAATTPFAAVQPGPDTASSGAAFAYDWAHCSGYQFCDQWLWRFSQTHLNGTGCSGLGNIGILPFVDEVTNGIYRCKMDKKSERACPGYYSVGLVNGITCEMTAFQKTAFYRFAYPRGKHARLLLDLDWAISKPGDGTGLLGIFDRNVKASNAEFPDLRHSVGRQCVFAWCETDFKYALESSHPMLSKKCVQRAGNRRGEIWEIDFGDLSGVDLEIRISIVPGTEPTSTAARILREESGDRSFDENVARAQRLWRDFLGRIELSCETNPDVAESFRSALYRTALQPNDYGFGWGYSTFSLWDTFRAAHPLYTVVCPERVLGFVESMVRQYERQGFLPIWALAGRETYCMIGHHSVPVIVDAFLKRTDGHKITDLDSIDGGLWRRAYAAVVDSLTREHKSDSEATWGLLKEDWTTFAHFGYLPYDRLAETYRGKRVIGESVSRTLECAYDYACASRFAEALGKGADAQTFSHRAASWTNLIDRTLGCVRGRDSSGSWRTPFDMYNCSHGPWSDSDFTEGNAWQYTWHVLHEPKVLVGALGGREEAVRRLDRLFSTSRDARGEGKGDVTGLIGQYAHGNEPSHHVIYFYSLLGRRDRTAECIREVFDRLYAPKPEGLCGNDDCGQMAAWYVFSALGFYPFDPCGGDYVIGAPQVPGAKISLSGGRTFEMRAKGLSKANKYVKSVRLNGKEFRGAFIRHSDIVGGGMLEFEMAASPD